MQQVWSFNQSVAVTPDDAQDILPGLPNVYTVGIYVGSGGDIVLVDAGGTAVKFTAVPTGTFIPAWVRRVNATGTTATNIVACYAR